MKVLVTGASSGIGRDMCRHLSSLGHDLIMVSRDQKKMEELANELSTNIQIISLDLSAKENCYVLYEKVKEESIDMLINGAGFGLFGTTWETDLDTELKMIDLNIKAVHILTKLFLKDMMKKDKGIILNIASSAGFLSGPRLNTYYATKNYIAKWTMGIYEELRKEGSHVHISCLCPGPVNTNFNRVAGGNFSIKALSSSYVAKYGIDKALKNKLIIVPGLGVKIGLFLNRFIPWKISLKIVYRIQEKKSRSKKRDV